MKLTIENKAFNANMCGESLYLQKNRTIELMSCYDYLKVVSFQISIPSSERKLVPYYDLCR